MPTTTHPPRARSPSPSASTFLRFSAKRLSLPTLASRLPPCTTRLTPACCSAASRCACCPGRSTSSRWPPSSTWGASTHCLSICRYSVCCGRSHARVLPCCMHAATVHTGDAAGGGFAGCRRVWAGHPDKKRRHRNGDTVYCRRHHTRTRRAHWCVPTRHTSNDHQHIRTGPLLRFLKLEGIDDAELLLMSNDRYATIHQPALHTHRLCSPINEYVNALLASATGRPSTPQTAATPRNPPVPAATVAHVRVTEIERPSWLHQQWKQFDNRCACMCLWCSYSMSSYQNTGV